MKWKKLRRKMKYQKCHLKSRKRKLKLKKRCQLSKTRKLNLQMMRKSPLKWSPKRKWLNRRQRSPRLLKKKSPK